MEQPQEVRHISVNGRFRVVLERAASTKGIVGVKVECNDDDLINVANNATNLYDALCNKYQVEGEVKNDTGNKGTKSTNTTTGS